MSKLVQQKLTMDVSWLFTLEYFTLSLDRPVEYDSFTLFDCRFYLLTKCCGYPISHPTQETVEIEVASDSSAYCRGCGENLPGPMPTVDFYTPRVGMEFLRLTEEPGERTTRDETLAEWAELTGLDTLEQELFLAELRPALEGLLLECYAPALEPWQREKLEEFLGDTP